MQRPMGPRPDKRQTAYADIFGRPAATHHQYPRPPPATSTMTYSQSYNGQNVYYGQQYDQQQDVQQSVPQTSQGQYGQQYPPSAFRQPLYPSQTSNPMYSQYQYLSPQDRRYPHSSASSSRSTGVIAPYPQEPPDPSLEALTRSGMTPAQAYQAQVYSNRPPHAPAVQSQLSHRPSSSSPENKFPISSPDPKIPQLDFQPTGGRLDIEFGDNSQLDQNKRMNGNAADTFTAQALQTLTITDEPAPYQNTPGPSSRPYPLQLETAMGVDTRTLDNNSPASTTYVDRVSPSPSSPRRSSDSIRTLPRPNGARRERAIQDRSRSMSATTAQAKNIIADIRQNARPAIPQFPGNGDLPTPTSHVSTSSRRTPIVYPALLSRVAQAFLERIQLNEKFKDGLTYTDAFDGREAVDKIAYIIKTTDRNLALLLGRALDAQKFFHDVTYVHRLRDTPHEIYQFRTMPTPFGSGELNEDEDDRKDPKGDSSQTTPAPSREESPDATRNGDVQRNAQMDDAPLPSGVFTLLTDCYSPTCSRDSLCYSIACPRRLEQQARLNMRPQRGLKRSSRESLADVVVEPGTLWIHSVPQEIVDSVSDTEKKRQEAINEVIYTERDFVRDMEYLRDVWIGPLKTSPIIPEERRIEFLGQVFWNIHDIIAVNIRLRDALNKRQKSYAIIERIGDIFLEHVPHFAPFVSYGSHQLYGKYEFEKEKGQNPEFQKFVDETERLPESRKLELNGYLTKPTTRLARYPLLLEVVLKYTPDDNPDKKDLVRVVELVREFLSKVNVESGKTENRFNLMQLSQQLVFRPGEEVDLKLGEEGREIVYKGTLKRRGGAQGDSGDLQLFLFDHLLLMVKQKEKHKHEMHKVYRRPIPLELLLVCAPDEQTLRTSTTSRPSHHNRTLVRKNSFNKSATPYPPVIPVKSNPKDGYSITFIHLGRMYYSITLYATTQVARRKWVETIQKQQDVVRERSMAFDMVTLSEGFFLAGNRVNCAVPFDRGQRVAYGTNDGVYFSNLRDPNAQPMRVLPLMDVTQIDILEEFQLLIVLSEHQVLTFPLEAISEHDPMGGLRRAKRIATHTTFFKAGICLGRTLVCIVKASQFSSTIKALEPIEYATRGKNKPTFKKILQGGNDTLRLFKEFYIPVESGSIHYLKTKLCVGCTKGFEIVDLETLDTQALLDPQDTSLEFLQKREDAKPLAIYRIENDFLLCYDEFAFYVNRSGWRARKDLMIHWTGHPRSFALHYPYVLAFDPTFIEVVNVLTGNLTQVIQGNNLRCLFADAPPSTTHAPRRSFGGPSPMHHAQYTHGPGYGGLNVGVDPRMNVVGNRTSIASSYSSHSQTYYDHGTAPGMNVASPSMYSGSSSASTLTPYERNEIIIVSDDRVMAIKLASGNSRQADNSTVTSHTSHTY